MNEIVWLSIGSFNWIVLLPYMMRKKIYPEVEPMVYVMSFIYGPIATLIHIFVLILTKFGVADNNSDNQP
jgi:hypothetical protein